MIKTAALTVCLIICLALSGCGEPGPSAQPSLDAASPSGTAPVYTPEAPAPDAIPFTRAKDIYADPQAFRGKAYSNLFQITGAGKTYGEMPACYAKSVSFLGALDPVYTVLCFPGGMVRALSADDIVYARGVIKGTDTIALDSDTSADALILDISYMEYNAAKAGIVSGNARYEFKEGECKGSSGALSVEITEMFFSADDTVVCVETADSSLTESKTYYFNIIAHQDGYFAWNYRCQFRIDPGSVSNFDYVLFPSLNSEKGMTIEFAPYNRDGEVLYDPVVISVMPGGETKE